MIEREYKVANVAEGRRELHVFLEGDSNPVARVFVAGVDPFLSVDRRVELPWHEFRERVDRFFQAREWSSQPEERAAHPELHTIRALLESFQRGEINGLDFSRAYFAASRGIQNDVQSLPSEVAQILDHLFVELTETIWPTETYMKGEEEGIWYNGPESISPVIEDTLAALAEYL